MDKCNGCELLKAISYCIIIHSWSTSRTKHRLCTSLKIVYLKMMPQRSWCKFADKNKFSINIKCWQFSSHFVECRVDWMKVKNSTTRCGSLLFWTVILSNGRSGSTYYSIASFLLVRFDHMASEHGKLEVVGWVSFCTFNFFFADCQKWTFKMEDSKHWISKIILTF